MPKPPVSRHSAAAFKQIKPLPCYQTTDGELHRSKESAHRHQTDILIHQEANERLRQGESVGSILFSLGAPPPDQVLYLVTKDSKFRISHWQCRDEAGYSPIRFNLGLRSMFVHGYAGSWSGAYGNNVPIADLVRYANDERSQL